MITLVYFASFREKLEQDREQMDLPAAVLNVADLIGHIVSDRDAVWQETLQAANVLVAVNQEMVEEDHPVADGDEVAFFPPVTGG
jgi:molybdopterin synthase sulfur carrier subunit